MKIDDIRKTHENLYCSVRETPLECDNEFLAIVQYVHDITTIFINTLYSYKLTIPCVTSTLLQRLCISHSNKTMHKHLFLGCSFIHSSTEMTDSTL